MGMIPFQKNKKKKQIIIVFSIGLMLLVAGIILYQTYSLFEETEDYDVIKGSVPNYLDNYDIKINFKVDGVSVNQTPTREDKKGVESITCDKGAMGSWDYFHWNFNVNSLSQTKTTCTVNFVTRYTEDILNGTDPIWKDELIPVTIDNNGTVHKANVQEKWYEYGNQQWANAVILEDESINYQNGEEIPESNIESYFVWIPRYKYKIFDMGEYEGLTTLQNRPQIIDIQFGVDTTNDSDNSCKTPGISGESGTCSVGKYMTHPAFISFESIGMWVGKFETGYKGATTKEEAQKNENNPDKVIIKPNVYSWRGINVSNAHLSSYNYKRNLDSHMMKNTEWGAVTYLQHSKFGSRSSVRINNNSNYLTGYASKKEPTCGFTGDNQECNRYEKTSPGVDGSYTINYFNSVSNVASTTGNYSGVFDMSGGSWEYVMGIMFDSTNGNSLKNNVFYFPKDKQYYDMYVYAMIEEGYRRRILGDATGEIGPFADQTYATLTRPSGSWYGEEAWFVSSNGIWFARGGLYASGTRAGVFAFSRDYGIAYGHISFRIVLTV